MNLFVMFILGFILGIALTYITLIDKDKYKVVRFYNNIGKTSYQVLERRKIHTNGNTYTEWKEIGVFEEVV